MEYVARAMLCPTTMTDLLDALRDAPDLDELDALDALIDAQHSTDHQRYVRHTAVANERAIRERALVPSGG